MDDHRLHGAGPLPRMPARKAVAVVACACILVGSAAYAQAPPPPPPAPPAPAPPAPSLPALTFERDALVRDLQARSVGVVSRATRDSVRVRLSPFGRRFHSAPLEAWTSFDAEADVAEPDAPWHAWGSPHLGWSRRDHPVVGYDGTQYGASAGLDRRIGDRSVLGFLVHHETADFTTKPVNGSLRSHLTGIGAYGGIALGETVVVDAMILWQTGKTRLREAGATGAYDNQRWSFAANLAGYHSFGPVQVVPTIGVDLSLDRQGAFTDSLGYAYPARRIDTAALTAALELGREFSTGGGGPVTPFVGAGVRYDVMRRDSGAVGPTYEPPRLDLSVRLGMRAEPTPAISFSLEMDASGLARRDQAALGANARLGVRF